MRKRTPRKKTPISCSKIEITNFQRIEHQKLELLGFCLFIGVSNKGKSSVRRAFSSVLKGTFKNNTEEEGEFEEGYRKKDTKETIISLQVAKDQIIYTKSKSKNIYEVNKQLLPKGGRGIPQEIQDLGYGVDGVHIASQQDPLFIIGESSSVITKTLNTVFKVKLFEEGTNITQREIKNKNSEINLIQTEVNEEVQELEDYNKILTVLKVKELLEHKINLIQEYKELLQQHKEIKDTYTNFKSLTDHLKLIEYRKLQQQQKDTLQQSQAIENLLRLLQKLDLIQSYSYLKTTIANHKEDYQKIAELVHTLSNIELIQEHNELLQDKSEALQSEKELTKELNLVNQKLKKYTCSKCNQLIRRDND